MSGELRPLEALRSLSVRLWPEAVAAAWAHRARGWWHRPPFVPLPAPELMAWRRATAYGSEDHPVEPADLEAYLRWRRRLRRVMAG